MKDKILYLIVFIFILCILHNILFRIGFFGGSTYAEYNNNEVRVLKVRNQLALISCSFTNKLGLNYSERKNDKWIKLEELNFSINSY